MAYIIKRKDGRTDQKIWKTKAKAEARIRGLIKNNSLDQRKMTGFIGMRVVKINPSPQVKEKLKKAKYFIFSQ